jgi:5-methylcytosine-specific restriction protein A
MVRNPTWSRDELILALHLYLHHREQLPDNDAPEITELSQVLNSLFGGTARDAALFRNPNGVYMKLANFRAVDPLHTSQGKRGLSRGGHGVEEVWAEFAEHPAELNALAAAIRAAAGSVFPAEPENDDGFAESYRRILVTAAWVRRRLWLEASLPRLHLPTSHWR